MKIKKKDKGKGASCFDGDGDVDCDMKIILCYIVTFESVVLFLLVTHITGFVLYNVHNAYTHALLTIKKSILF